MAVKFLKTAGGPEAVFLIGEPFLKSEVVKLQTTMRQSEEAVSAIMPQVVT